jgi:hypothetical protein
MERRKAYVVRFPVKQDRDTERKLKGENTKDFLMALDYRAKQNNSLASDWTSDPKWIYYFFPEQSDSNGFLASLKELSSLWNIRFKIYWLNTPVEVEFMTQEEAEAQKTCMAR